MSFLTSNTSERTGDHDVPESENIITAGELKLGLMTTMPVLGSEYWTVNYYID